MTKKMDRRKTRTRALLRKALIEVMEEKGAERITVSDLTEKADVNRGTFYLHYTDATDILAQVKAEMWEGLTARMEKLNPYDYLSYAARNEPDPIMVRVIEYYAEHADFFRVILGPKGDPAFADQIKEFLKTQHISKILDIQPELGETILPKDYMVEYFAASNLSILLHWIKTGMPQSASTIALMITQIVGSAAKQLYGIEVQNPDKKDH
ncbi:TetR/AcrR family transcriptional regulator [Pseudalkalibacillus decolorationis]|uniref:TetR/AcrR family transcriptional regulator n=1 Tax=Pseudalkalibacillus decolorationis TaxID=163879 RepID=UPI002147B8E3|nr:TetR/AcrR family transcriptional regulator [Pseudalkalibacillus decolorationis]